MYACLCVSNKPRCDEALTRVADEPAGTGEPVQMGESHRKSLALIVPGVGWECIETWLKLDDSVSSLMESFGFQTELVKVDGLSGVDNNARQIRDFIADLPAEFNDYKVLLIGYSKGAPDILEAIVQYPELKDRVVAVISAAGAIGGSPLANAADQKDLNIIRRFPGADCSKGDGGAVRPAPWVSASTAASVRWTSAQCARRGGDTGVVFSRRVGDL